MCWQMWTAFWNLPRDLCQSCCEGHGCVLMKTPIWLRIYSSRAALGWRLLLPRITYVVYHERQIHECLSITSTSPEHRITGCSRPLLHLHSGPLGGRTQDRKS